MSQRVRTILVVDDNRGLGRFIERTLILEDEPFRVLGATDGEQALEVVTRELPDVVLLNEITPRLDGHAICRAIKSDPDTRRVKVILLTHRGLGQQEGAWLGPDAFLAKPFSTTELLGTIRALLWLRT